MSIAQEISRLTSAKADIKTAIEGKGVTVPSSTLLDGYADLIDQIEQGAAEEAPENNVNFYDYDGKRIASFTIAEAKALTLADYDAIRPPAHEGLTFQGWNWSLSDIQSYNRRYADIGANYITTDGKTHLKVRMTDFDAVLSLYIVKGSVLVEWGDGENDTYSVESSGNVACRHTYPQPDEYTIKFSFTASASDSAFGFRTRANSNYWSTSLIIQELNCGNYFSFGLTDRGMTFVNAKISIGATTDTDGEYVFLNSSVPCICIPKGATFSRTGGLVYCSAIICLPRSTSDYANLSAQNATTQRLIIPECTDSTQVQTYYNFQNLYYTQVLSLPLSFTFPTRTQADFFAGSSSLEVIDICQGWVPNQNIRFNYGNRWSAEAMVDFFTKLGTTSTAITLTFSNVNLAKLTAEEKAIATDKGYTLA